MTDASEARPTSADSLRERVDAAWPRFASGVRHVGLRHFDDLTSAGWRYRDLVAHATVWHGICADGLTHFAQHGKRPEGEFEGADVINAEAARSATGVDAETLIHDLDRSWDDLRERLAALGDDDLVRDDGWVVGFVAENTWEHYDEHLAELRAARPDTVATFLARLEDDWSLMDDAIGRLGPAGLDRPTPAGWRYRDVVAHSAGWLVDALERLPEVRADPQVVFAPLDIDAMNARAIERRAGDTTEGLITEIGEAYRALTSAIGELSDEELADRRISGFIAVRSYLHLDEHLAELEAAGKP